MSTALAAAAAAAEATTATATAMAAASSTATSNSNTTNHTPTPATNSTSTTTTTTSIPTKSTSTGIGVRQEGETGTETQAKTNTEKEQYEIQSKMIFPSPTMEKPDPEKELQPSPDGMEINLVGSQQQQQQDQVRMRTRNRDLDQSTPKPRRQRRTTVVRTFPRPPGGYKYSMKFLYDIGEGLTGEKLDIPTPSSITPRTVRTTPPTLTTHMPLLSSAGISVSPRPNGSSPGSRYAGGAAASGAAGATTSSAGSASPGAVSAAQFIYQGYLPSGPQRRLWHTENAVWQFDRNYPYNQGYSSQYGIPIMPLGFEHTYAGQRIIYPGYYNQATGGLHTAQVPGMPRSSRLPQSPHQNSPAPSPSTTTVAGEATEKSTSPTTGNSPHIATASPTTSPASPATTWRYARPNSHRDRLASGRGGGAVSGVPVSASTAFHRESKTFYNSTNGGMGGGPRYKPPFDQRTVGGNRTYVAAGTSAGASGSAAGSSGTAAGASGTAAGASGTATGAASTGTNTVASATAGGATTSDPPATNQNRNFQGSTNTYQRPRPINKRNGKNPFGKEKTSNSSGSLSASSSKSQLGRPSSTTSMSPNKHPQRNYRNRMRYNAMEPTERKSGTVSVTVPVGTYQPPQLQPQPPLQNQQPPSQQQPQSAGRRPKYHSTYHGHAMDYNKASAHRQPSRYFQSRQVDGHYVYQPGHYMVYAPGMGGVPGAVAVTGGGSGASGSGQGVGAAGGATAGSAGAGGQGGGGAATATASSTTSEGEQPLETDFDQRHEYADLGLDPAHGGFSSDLEPLGYSNNSHTTSSSHVNTHHHHHSHSHYHHSYHHKQIIELDTHASSDAEEPEDDQSCMSLASSLDSDGSDSELSDASVESVVRNVMASCLAEATGTQVPELSGPNLVPYGDMHYLRELERKSQHTNGYRSHHHHKQSHLAAGMHHHMGHGMMVSPRGMGACCGDMEDFGGYKLEPDGLDGLDSGSKGQVKGGYSEEADSISVASNLSCTPSACSSKSTVASMGHKAIMDDFQEDELPLVIHNRYWSEFFGYTPADRFLLRSKQVEMRRPPRSVPSRNKWEPLSLSIWKKFLDAQQTQHLYKIKMRLWRFIYSVTMSAYPKYGLYLVGSSISNFGSKCSDMDICMLACTNPNLDPRMEAVYHLQLMRGLLYRTNVFQDFNLIEARVPILRFTDRQHKVEVDINFNNSVGIRNTHLLYCYSQLEWRVRPMALTVKQWAQYHNINNAKNMTISSYSLSLMVIHFLQSGVNPPVLPCLHKMYPDKFTLLQPCDFGYVDMNEVMGPYQSENTQSLGELMLSFLHYYSIFEYGKYAISIRVGGVLPVEVCRASNAPKNDIHQWNELCIEEPFDQTNTARSVYDSETFERIRAIFHASYRRLESTRNLSSIFEGYDGPTILMQPPTLESVEGDFFENHLQSLHNRGSVRSLGHSKLMVDKATTAVWSDINGKLEQNEVPLDHLNVPGQQKTNLQKMQANSDDSVATTATEPPLA
ncbi:poly(A) RNA polymerase gld-2 homolog A [Drosophila bipectinata]|uniref:poly(A) RNA polymerase gld-2 homolog A n=1 Tax=Drosophila bipectinata TaxID=42026 RepID=UPI0038B2AB5B